MDENFIQIEGKQCGFSSDYPHITHSHSITQSREYLNFTVKRSGYQSQYQAFDYGRLFFLARRLFDENVKLTSF